MSPEALSALRDQVGRYQFRGLHPLLRFGTASDRYAGWAGQIYTEDTWGRFATTRTKTLGRENYIEKTLPVGSTREYFEHFAVVELDFTFYRPLLDASGEPTSNYFVLEKYADQAPSDAAFVLKAPQAYSARTLRRRGSYVANESYLDAEAYVAQFHEPALRVLGDRLTDIIFEQEYQRVAESPDPDAFVAHLDAFFAAVPRGVAHHLEIRSEHLLTPAYFDWLAREELGHVFSHWTWLPPIKRQWELAGGRFTAASSAVLRLLTPLRMKYADAYALAHPFDRAVPELSETEQAVRMVNEAVALAYQAIEQKRRLAIISNNRAWGNAPQLAQALASRFLDFAGDRLA